MSLHLRNPDPLIFEALMVLTILSAFLYSSLGLALYASGTISGFSWGLIFYRAVEFMTRERCSGCHLPLADWESRCPGCGSKLSIEHQAA